ncbi:MAG: transglutaminaseTgpA domain-containing protein [Pseudobdellovibrionaceae bacterium]
MIHQFFQRPALVFSLCGLTILTCLEVPAFMSLFCLIFWAWKWLADLKIVQPLSRRWTTILSFVLLALILAQYRSLFIQEASSSLLVGLTALKVMDYQNRRDHLLLILLGFLLLTLKPLYGLDLFLLPVQLVCMFSLWMALSQDTKKLPRTVLLKVIGSSLPIALLLFLVFPRVVLPWAISKNQRSSRMGFSTDLNPGQVADLASSTGIVLRAVFPPDSDVNPQELYWKGAVLTSSNGLAWKDPKLMPLHERPVPPAEGQVVFYEIIQEPGNGNVVFALDSTYSLRSIGAQLVPHEASVWRVNGAVNSSRRYHGISSYSYINRLKPLASDLKTAPLPPLSEEWVKKTIAGNKDLLARRRALRQLFSHPDFVYTLNPGPYEKSAMDEFLFQRRRGFCEHFAGAYATLARALGIPARVVSGYQGAEYNRLGGFWKVTQKQAHAWVEIWTGDQWQRQDPTTWILRTEFSRYPKKSFFDWIDDTYNTYEALNYRWTTFLLDFDRNSQSQVLREWLPRIFLILTLGVLAFFLLKLLRGWTHLRGGKIKTVRHHQLSQLVRQIRESEEEYLNQDLSHIPPLQILSLAKKHIRDGDEFLNRVAALYDKTFYQGESEELGMKAELQVLQKKWLDIQVMHK